MSSLLVNRTTINGVLMRNSVNNMMIESIQVEKLELQIQLSQLNLKRFCRENHKKISSIRYSQINLILLSE